jgi:hypothetical protein
MFNMLQFSVFTGICASRTRLRDQPANHLRRRMRPPPPCPWQPPLASSCLGMSPEFSAKPSSLTTLQQSAAMAAARPSPSWPISDPDHRRRPLPSAIDEGSSRVAGRRCSTAPPSTMPVRCRRRTKSRRGSPPPRH